MLMGKILIRIESVLCVGSLIGNSLVEHPDVRKVGFTGSTPVGKDIMRRYIVYSEYTELYWPYFEHTIIHSDTSVY